MDTLALTTKVKKYITSLDGKEAKHLTNLNSNKSIRTYRIYDTDNITDQHIPQIKDHFGDNLISAQVNQKEYFGEVILKFKV